MHICENCKREIEENHLYCGYCGAPAGKKEIIVIDGRKNHRLKTFVNKIWCSEKINYTATIITSILFIVALYLGITSIVDIISGCDEVFKILGQLLLKIEYLKEGVSLSYISSEARWLLGYLNDIMIVFGAFVGALFAGFGMFFNLGIIHLKKKYNDEYEYKKPVRLIKICLALTKIMLIFLAVYIFIVAAVNIIGAIVIL